MATRGLSETRSYGYSRPFRNSFIWLLATFQKLVHMATHDLSETRSYGYSRVVTFQKLVHIATRDLSETRSYGYSRPFRNSFIWLLATFQKLVHMATRDLSETRSYGYSQPFRNSDDVKARAASRIIGIISKVKKLKNPMRSNRK